MNLRDFLLGVGTSYHKDDGFTSPAQTRLKTASSALAAFAPLGYRVRGSGGQYPLNTTETPWIGFFDPDETTSATEGLYVVYLLRADQTAWELVLLTGTERRARLATEASTGERGLEDRVRQALRAETTQIRSALADDGVTEWESSIDLRSRGKRQLRYEAATICARSYPLSDLPTEDVLRADLNRMLNTYERAVRVKRRLAVLDPDAVSTRSETHNQLSPEIDYRFEPGEDRASVVRTTGAYTRTPRHETGLRSLGTLWTEMGLQVSTRVHHRDLVVATPDHWLVEYKVVYAGDETRASRDALSQLREYAYFLYPKEASPRLLAAFSAPLSDLRLEWLQQEGIQAVWFEDGHWRGTSGAVAAGLAQP